MLLQIRLPERDQTLAMLRDRWDAAMVDPHWRDIEGKFESNSFGQIVVTPPPPFAHADRASRIAQLLQTLLGGRGITEVPTLTLDGVKVPDAVWMSESRYESVREQTVVEVAAEICVEVLSERNTDAEMRHKRVLYFDHGAVECWVCDLEGRMTYYRDGDPDAAHETSSLCPGFPGQIDD